MLQNNAEIFYKDTCNYKVKFKTRVEILEK